MQQWLTGICSMHNPLGHNRDHNRASSNCGPITEKGQSLSPAPLCALSGFRLVRADYVYLNAQRVERAVPVWVAAVV